MDKYYVVMISANMSTYKHLDPNTYVCMEGGPIIARGYYQESSNMFTAIGLVRGVYTYYSLIHSIDILANGLLFVATLSTDSSIPWREYKCPSLRIVSV